MSSNRAYGLPGTSQHYTSATLPRTSQPKGFPHPAQFLSRQRSAKSAEPELAPNLPVLYNKYAEDLVRMPATPEADETLATDGGKGNGKGQQTPAVPQTPQTPVPPGITRNRSVPPDPQRFVSGFK